MPLLDGHTRHMLYHSVKLSDTACVAEHITRTSWKQQSIKTPHFFLSYNEIRYERIASHEKKYIFNSINSKA